jgi:hypothetical protein
MRSEPEIAAVLISGGCKGVERDYVVGKVNDWQRPHTQ